MNNPFKKNRFEIIYHLIDCGIAFSISFLSAFLVAEDLTIKLFMVSFLAAFLIGMVKFRDYWNEQHNEYNKKMRMIFA